jgi:hypothetical protein
MRKILALTFLLIFGLTAFSQAVKDRNVVPVAVTLNQVLRMTITNGGNIEFVFNTIDDYKNGLSADALASGSANPVTSNTFYRTDFTVASSTRWKLVYGAEEATFIGTDLATHTIALNNVGFRLVSNGTNVFGAAGAPKGTAGSQLFSTPTNNGTEVSALRIYATDLIEDNDLPTDSNAGDASDNSFTLNWRCGTAEAGAANPMNLVRLIDQSPSPAPDRYIVNVLFDLAID